MNHAIRYFMSGDFHTAVNRCEQARELLRGSKNIRIISLYYIHSSMAYHYTGSFQKGLENAETGLRLVRERGVRDFTLGWFLLGCSMNSLGLRKITDAIDYGNKALSNFRETGSLWGEAYTCAVLQTIFIQSGDLPGAEDIISKGLEVLNTIDLPNIKSQLFLGQAMVRAMRGNMQEVEPLLKEACSLSMESPFVSWWCACIRTTVFMFQGKTDKALDHAREGLRISMAHGYDAWVVMQLPLLLVPLAALYEQGEMKEYLQLVFSKIDPDLKAMLTQMKSMGISEMAHACETIFDALPQPPPPGLKIYCLGRFQLFRGQDEIPAHDWTSKKARTLFKLLVHYRSKGYVNKEVFMEHLWPEDDPEKTAKRFHVALAALRKTLDPTFQRGMASAYVSSDGDNYHLSLGEGGRVDLDEFEEVCGRAEEAKDHEEALGYLLRAEEVYSGDFLEEDLYEPWCMEERDRIRGQYLAVVASIIEYYESRREYQKAIDYCGRYLLKDAYAEDIYQRLMRYHALTGNRAMVRKTYERCRKCIVDDLNCSLSKETIALAEESMPEDLD